MKFWQATVLGAVQGLTEFLPVSSSAHLQLTSRLLKIEHPGLVLETSLHLGTLAATLLWLREQSHEVLKLPLLTRVALGTLPAGLAGFVLEHWIETHLRSPQFTALLLVLGGTALGWTETHSRQNKTMQHLSLSDALWIGLSQMLALMPGLSRSGMTTMAGLLRGLTRRDALRFSFLLSLPVVAGSGLFKLKDLAHYPQKLWPYLLTGGLTAAVSGYACLEWMLDYFERHSLKGLALYRLVLGGSQLFWSRAQLRQV